MRDASSLPDPIPDLLLERYLLGELPEAARLRVEMRLGFEPGLKERLEALRASDAEFLKTHPPERMAHATRERMRREAVERDLRKARGFGLAWRLDFSGRAGGALVGACVLAILAVPAWRVLKDRAPDGPAIVADAGTPSANDPVGTAADASSGEATEATDGQARPEDEEPMILALAEPGPDVEGAPYQDTRIKGIQPSLALFRKTREGSEPLRPGDKARPGDVLRIGYRAAGVSFGAIVSVDGNGKVTRHWPVAGDRSARLEHGEILLPDAFELDAAPDYERFYFLTSPRAFDLKPVLESLGASKAPVVQGVTIVRFDLLKDNGI